MILFEVDIRSAIRTREIEFDPPLEDQQWGEAWIELRLGFSAPRPACLSNLIDADQKLTVEPQRWVSGVTYESIRLPDNIIAFVEGKLEYGQSGLIMGRNEFWIPPRWRGPIIFEIGNTGTFPITLTPVLDRPCRVTFFSLKGKSRDNRPYWH